MSFDTCLRGRVGLRDVCLAAHAYARPYRWSAISSLSLHPGFPPPQLFDDGPWWEGQRVEPLPISASVHLASVHRDRDGTTQRSNRGNPTGGLRGEMGAWDEGKCGRACCGVARYGGQGRGRGALQRGQPHG